MSSDGPASPDPRARLLDVQAVDLALDRIDYRHRQLPEREAVASLDGRIGELEARGDSVRQRRDDLARRQSQIDEHVNEIRARIARIEERLRSGRAGSFRDEQAMAEEAASLDAQRRSTEDREIEVMEELEPVEEELSAIEGEVDALRAELGEATAALSTAEADLVAERESVSARRGPLVADLPAQLLGEYDRLRDKLGGVGVAKLVDGACSGCHLKLPSSERDHLVHAPAGTIVHCEQCGRILVP